jgi:hypothetical protein
MRTILAALLVMGCTERSPGGNAADASTATADAAAGDGGSADGGSACDKLDEQTCWATGGCVADYCLACTCTPSFHSCRGANEQPATCPAYGCPAPFCCRTDAECGGLVAGNCAITPPPSCGQPCPGPSTCTVDGDCGGGGMICDPNPCCSQYTQCQQGCTGDDQCVQPGSYCDAGRCSPTSCPNGASDCAANSYCALTPAGGGPLCLPKGCTTDADCDHPGFCVENQCENALGMCYPLSP